MNLISDPPILYLIIPCYNEEDALLSAAQSLHNLLQVLLHGRYIAPGSRILFVDDGSDDHTWQQICHLASSDQLCAGIRLSRNFGHQNALLAGLMEARFLCHVSISLDADLQDDPAVIPAMLDSFSQGSDVVYGIRRDRSCDTFPKRLSAKFFYRLIHLLGIEMPSEAGDFRLMSRCAMDALALCPEHQPFLRGLIPRLGFSSDYVFFDRRPRTTGHSKYTLRRMTSFALDGLLSLSLRPLLLILPTGLLMVCIAFLFFLTDITGSLAICISIWLVGGIITCALGILGLYAGKIYTELLKRPRYIIKETLNLEK